VAELRVLFVCLGDFHAPPGPRQIYAFARALTEEGHRARILVQGDPATIHELGAGVDPRVEVGAYRFGVRGLTRETLHESASFAPNIVHLYEPRHAPATAALELAGHLGAPLFVRVADDDRFIEDVAGRPALRWRVAKGVLKRLGVIVPPAWPFAHPRSYERLVREAQGFDAISPALARETAARIGRPCRAILPAIWSPEMPGDARGARAAAGLPSDARLVLYAGSVYRPHFADFELLLRAFALLARQRDDVHLVHTGRIAARYGREVLAGLAGAGRDRLHLLGFLPTEQDVMRLMASCDVLVQPGAPTDFNRFRFPAKLHDYLASGRPVVSYAAGVEEVLTDGEHALLTRTAEPEELADAIGRLLDDDELAGRLAAESRRRAADVFSPERAARELVAYYREAA